MINNFEILARTTQKLEEKTNKNGNKFVTVPVAIKQNNSANEPQYLTLFANGKVAENLLKIVPKGSLVLFKGQISPIKNNNQTTIYLVIDGFELLSTPSQKKERENEDLKEDFPF